MSSWCTIESDPGVFTELIKKLGVKGVVVEEIYSLEQIPGYKAKPYGLVFLFQWKKSENSDSRRILDASEVPEVFFAQQVVNNACATQAIINVLCNAKGVELGEAIEGVNSFRGALPPNILGEAIGENDTIREVHNSFAPPDMFEIESKEATDDDEVFHFVGYVPVDGKLYELDGLKEGPILVNEDVTDENWLEAAKAAIEHRVELFQASGVNYALLSLEPDPLPELQAKATTGDAEAQIELAEIESKREQWHKENERRRFNYIPFIMALTKELADAGVLKSLAEQSEAETQRKRDAQRKRNAEKTSAKADVESNDK